MRRTSKSTRGSIKEERRLLEGSNEYGPATQGQEGHRSTASVFIFSFPKSPYRCPFYSCLECCYLMVASVAASSTALLFFVSRLRLSAISKGLVCQLWSLTLSIFVYEMLPRQAKLLTMGKHRFIFTQWDEYLRTNFAFDLARSSCPCSLCVGMYRYVLDK